MGRQTRQTRQARRAQERRHAQRGQSARPVQHRGQRGSGLNWSIIGPVGVVLVAIAFFIIKATGVGVSSPAPTPTAEPLAAAVAGIKCDRGMTPGYHIHAHLEIYNNGKQETISPDFGHAYNNDCLYWLHAHDNIGIIHLEAPNKVTPTLATWLRVAKNTLGSSAPSLTPKPGQQRKVWVNTKPYTGDPLKIKIVQHEDITIEFGPKFVPPKKFDFAAHSV